MKFTDYKNTEKSKNDQNNILDKNQEAILKGFLKNYEGKSQSDLINEIIKVAEENRKKGKLSDADLDNFYLMLKPMVTKQQLSELEKIILRLKTQ